MRQDMGTSKTLKSSHIRFGKRTYFFDIKSSVNNKRFLKITESKFVEEGKDRQYNSFILFPENVADFQKYLKESVVALSLS